MMRNKIQKNATINPGNAAQSKSVTLLPKATHTKPSPVDRIKDWWKNHFGNQKARQATAQAVCNSIDDAIASFTRAMKFNILLALVAMLVVKFCPEVADKCPVFFQLCEGILVFYEYLLRVAFTLLKALIQFVTLNWAGATDSISAMFSEGGRLLTELLNWFQAITF